MLALFVVLMGILLGYISGGRLKGLLHTEIRLLWLPVIAYIMDAGGAQLAKMIPAFIPYSWILITMQYILLFIFIIINLFRFEFCLFGGGTLMNFLVISFNGFRMPVAQNLYLDTQGQMAGYIDALAKDEIYRYTLMTPHTVFPFLGDIIYVPVFGGFASIGDMFLAVGLAVILIRGMRADCTKKLAFE
ncbi:MAG TPA: DUF5317 family protein [Oscillospiraceae bacterium]|nr:DUF5317 family protein [Oscillospiraceae bacterium]HPF56103.1 DUF5317 family protein [Clostridiales bacterium]HPK35071.1 DUF5317 family protein [Oscillospiraceae bacterium]HPR75222.1 DUF5317 family protein [Oscillospiraceae bacterium]